MTGNAFAEEPCCVYEPKRATKPEAAMAGD